MKKTQMHRLRQLWGQGMAEYLIIVALVAIAAIGIYTAFGKTVRNQVAGIAKETAGEDSNANMVEALDSANAAAGRANDPRKAGLANYNYANDQR